MIKNQKITVKLLIMICPLVITLLINMVNASIRQVDIFKETEEIFNYYLYNAVQRLINADRDLYQAAVAEDRIFFQKDITQEEHEKQLLDFEENIEQTKDRFDQTMELIKEDEELYQAFSLRSLFIAINGEGAEDSANYKENSKTIAQIEKEFKKDFDVYLSRYNLETMEGDYVARKEAFNKARSHLNDLTELLDLYSVYEGNLLKQNINSDILRSVIFSSVLFAISIILAGMVAMYLRKNIVKLTKDMKKLATNDLTFTPLDLKTKDELGDLSRAEGVLFRNLTEMVKNMQQYSNNLVDSSKMVNQATTEINESMENIQAAAGEIANSMSSQSEETENVSNKVHFLDEVMQRSIQTTLDLTEDSSKINYATESGMEKIEDLMMVTKQNNLAFDNILNVIESINKSTEHIADASQMISGIAEQTNLLSLNANIEAARAGAAGKGFAIVAEEIRKLAEQSSESATSIDKMLSELQENVTLAKDHGVIVKESVSKQNESVNDTKEKYVDIVHSIKNVNQEIKQLEQVNLDLKSGFDALSVFVVDLSAISEENTAASEELSATMDSIRTNMTEISDTSNVVYKCSNSLEEMIKKFRF